jgi:hypothetical protein
MLWLLDANPDDFVEGDQDLSPDIGTPGLGVLSGALIDAGGGPDKNHYAAFGSYGEYPQLRFTRSPWSSAQTGNISRSVSSLGSWLLQCDRRAPATAQGAKGQQLQSQSQQQSPQSPQSPHAPQSPQLPQPGSCRRPVQGFSCDVQQATPVQ